MCYRCAELFLHCMINIHYIIIFFNFFKQLFYISYLVFSNFFSNLRDSFKSRRKYFYISVF